jgi:hypothetical protein
MVERQSATVGRDPRAALVLGGLLAVALVTRAVALDQPIVENYVGRQVPTAMVARNLERGSGFFRPSLDVAPLPNLFLVEPPVFAGLAVGLRWTAGLPLTDAGRLVSALGVVLGAWGLYGLVARREGVAGALTAVAVFVALPLTIRYGRAFQPDALMLGCLLAGLRCWDGFEQRGGIGRLAAGFVLLATGLALKVISAYVLVPLVAAVTRERRPWKLALAGATLLPAALWYAHAAGVIAAGGGSRASADNGGIWLRVLVPSALVRGETFGHVVRFFGVRSFTPLGPPMALGGFLIWRRPGDRLWLAWGASALATLAALAAKLHHEYYWLAVAPVVAVGVARSLTGLASRGVVGRTVAAAAAAGLVGLSAVLSASTWRTPPESASLELAARAVAETVPKSDWVVAPEALLFASDRRGCRLEFTRAAALRAAGEWGEPLGADGPAGLVEFYRRHGARAFADVRPDPIGPDRLALHDAVRRRYNVLVDQPGVLVALLNVNGPREDAPHGNGTGRPAEASAGRDDP